MASNITDSASFSSANMKPDADEEVAAIWGQNLADNTAYLYYDQKLVGNSFAIYYKDVGVSAVNNFQTFTLNKIILTKEAKHNQVTGTAWASYDSDDGAVAGTVRGFLDGTLVCQYSNGGVANGTEYIPFSWDSSNIPDGQNFEYQVDIQPTWSGGEELEMQMSTTLYSKI